MKRRTRYLLLLIGFIFFMITAPLIVLYVGGIAYDFSENRYVKTGILVVNTDPKSVHLSVDELSEGATPKKVKFLKPGEHTVTLTKDGYHTWSKRLEIKSAKTTWAAVGVDLVHLLKTDLAQKNLASGIFDFDFTNDGLIYLTQTQLVLANEDGEDQRTVDLPKVVTKVEMSENKQLALLRGPEATLIFSLSDQKIFDLSELAKGYEQLFFSNNNQLFSLQDKVLYKIDWDTNQITMLGQDITAFASADTDWYILQANNHGTQDLKVFSRNQSPSESQILTENLPIFAENKLLVTKNKELFVLGDQAVYKINSQLARLADGVISWHYDASTNDFLTMSPTELNHYNFATGTLELISRSSNPFSAPLLTAQIGYTFYSQDNQLHALELDRRDVQNNYQLINLPDIKKILATSNARYLYVHSGTELVKLTIRK